MKSRSNIGINHNFITLNNDLNHNVDILNVRINNLNTDNIHENANAHKKSTAIHRLAAYIIDKFVVEEEKKKVSSIGKPVYEHSPSFSDSRGCQSEFTFDSRTFSG